MLFPTVNVRLSTCWPKPSAAPSARTSGTQTSRIRELRALRCDDNIPFSRVIDIYLDLVRTAGSYPFHRLLIASDHDDFRWRRRRWRRSNHLLDHDRLADSRPRSDLLGRLRRTGAVQLPHRTAGCLLDRLIAAVTEDQLNAAG